MATAIEFNHVSKLYQLGVVGTGTLSNDLKRWWATTILGKEDPFLKVGQTNDRSAKANSDFVYALRDIDFKVEQGDVVGIIGKNGAGKSTLLKLLSRITAPTTGSIRARGRIASLLEVGTGFHGELTGRENIYMNGAIMGMTKQEIDRKLDEIIDFSGCEMYIDTPVKRYSSGMSVRLGFAVAAFLEPEILVVDEVLAVGDAEFQKKAIGKMQDVSTGEGRTVLFVSHNMNSVRRLCKSGVVLKNGMVEMIGSADECVEHYMSNVDSNFVSNVITNSAKYRPDGGRYKRELEFLEVSLLNESIDALSTDEPLHFRFKMKINDHNIKTSRFCCVIKNCEGLRIGYFMTQELEIPQFKEQFYIDLTINNARLPKGVYNFRFEVGLRDFTNGLCNANYDAVDDVLLCQVKYHHQALKDEYLYWNSAWSVRMDETEGVLAIINEEE